jgi:hypothetical protein
MADLKPLGSEKLEGQEQISRILEISNYGSKPTTLSENKNSKADYSIQMADGKYYGIVKEKTGYVVKVGISESELDYNEPMQNRKHYKSFSQAMKKVNLIAGELNRIHENTEGVNIIGEQKKFVLKTPEPKVDVDIDVDEPSMEPEADLDMDVDMDVDMGMDSEEGVDDLDMDLDLDLDDTEEEVEVDVDVEDEESSFKVIQKLTGKIGQKLRTYDKNQGLSSEDIKYVLNSIISAVELDKLSEEDKEDILANFEEDETDYDMEGEVDIDVESGDDELDLDMDLDLDMEEPLADEELSENSYALNQYNNRWYDPLDNELSDGFEDYDEEFEFGSDDYDKFMDMVKDIPNAMWNPMEKNMYDRFQSNPKMNMNPLKLRVKRKKGMGKQLDLPFSESDPMKSMVDEIFGESKVDKVLEKYFVVTDGEKKITESKKIKKFLAEKVNTISVKKEIKRLSESIEQELTSEFILKENTNIKFLGKTNKGNLIFESGKKQFKVTSKGELL